MSTQPDPRPTVVLSSLDVAVDIFMDGVSTGIATALANFAMTIPVEHRDLMTEEILRTISEDPPVMERLRAEVRARLVGGPGPRPYDMSVFGVPNGDT